MSAEKELYPGLDAELDAAFQRNTGLDSAEAIDTLEDVVQSEIGTTLAEADFQSQLDELNEQLLRAGDQEEFQALLQARERLIVHEVRRRSQEAKSSIDQEALEAQQVIAGNSQMLTVFNKAHSDLSQGRPWAPTAVEFIQKNAPSSAPTLRTGLNSKILAQATENLKQGRAWIDNSLEYIDEFAAAGSADQMKQALDHIILDQTIAIIRQGSPWAETSLEYLQNASPEAQGLIIQALEDFIFSQADHIKRQGAPWADEAKKHLDYMPSTELRQRAKEVLGL